MNSQIRRGEATSLTHWYNRQFNFYFPRALIFLYSHIFLRYFCAQDWIPPTMQDYLWQS